MVADVEPRGHAQSSRDAGTRVVHDGSVQVRHHHHVELLRRLHKLHGAVVDDHGIKNDVWIKLSDLFASSEKKAVAEFHDVGLVHGSDLKRVKEI